MLRLQVYHLLIKIFTLLVRGHLVYGLEVRKKVDLANCIKHNLVNLVVLVFDIKSC